MTGVFLQVRLDSARLPRKALLSLGGRTVIEHAMLGLRGLPADVFALLTDSDSAPQLGPLAERCGFAVVVGSKDDVLARYCTAIRQYGVDTVVRATGDNPLVSELLARMILAEHHSVGAEYSGYDGPPLGTGVEILSADALFIAEAEATRTYDREHVSPYLYTHPDRFHIHRIQAPARFCLAGSRVTLDTAEDFALLSELYDDLYSGDPVDVLEVIAWLEARSNRHTCRNSA